MNVELINEPIYLNIDNDEIWLIPQNDKKTLVYVPLREYLGVFTDEFYDEVKNVLSNGDIAEASIGHYLHEHISKYPLTAVEELISDEKKDIKLRDLCMVLSDCCNLACVYCHSDAGMANEILPFNLAKITIDKYIEDCIISEAKIARFQFAGGGEPTMHFALMKKIILYFQSKCDDHNLIPDIAMPTNGAFSIDIAKQIMELFDGISLSFDGPKEIFDIHRPKPDGSSAFDLVMNNAILFRENSFPFAIRVTVSNKTIEMADTFFNFFSENFPEVPVALEPLNPLGRGEKLTTEVCSPDSKAFTDFLIKAYKKSISSNFQFINSVVGKFNLLRVYYCMAIGQPAMTLMPNGDIVACTRAGAPDFYNFGKVTEKKGILFDHKAMKRLRDSNVTNFLDCRNCFCKYNCGGGCLDLRLSDNLRCDTVRELGNLLLRNKAGLF